MTPAARYQAAIEILDHVLDGSAAEQALTSWGRRSRFAGSKDRAAVRDHVFQALRCLRSYAVLGGARSGRGLVLGALRAAGLDPEAVFTGEGHAPKPLTEGEKNPPSGFSSASEEHDIPDWLWPDFEASLGAEATDAAQALRTRAPVHLRVNMAKGTRASAIAKLSDEDIITEAHPASETALTVLEGARKVKNSNAFQSGLVELQDAASQAVVDFVPLADGQKVLDFCAGGGGKSLALAARAKLRLFAHDADPKRMKDIAPRAERAGAQIKLLNPGAPKQEAPFDVVLCDAPCSGTGSWRRAPEGKWRLDRDGLDRTLQIQSRILDEACELVAPGGVLAYATCSMLAQENRDQVDAFLARTNGWTLEADQAWFVHQGTDGFYIAVLRHVA
ncbi:Ribosomal RNA small subunit methyltransferase B [Tritonibacter multivorans]|uniref:Ribosomal RNA small subunit methyltransferase B n=1 Tax=Tritonibacter multivorans TaxID=928856 RepID=A0A0P1GJX9_9RHOB|nr:RsmB/NOP family class I SAM-dependent RNA methyltransferase [Tritonibacter multivorans]MDA7421504.1 RsmB/NOP family class I SAM-dependent RNA methyltransferase [Tritonibacter multivorans]CUH82285.1 Ribosomal RNA small subunit methyltransferase B [Tritonibacter multivorans]SFC97635.1 16S rRNA (cytosine967-C5)-methyltransferase [Tritonibacter multivorans]